MTAAVCARPLTAPAVAAPLGVLAACHTSEATGPDIEVAGEAIEDDAEDASN